MAQLAPQRQRRRWTALVGGGLRIKLSRRIKLLNDKDHWKRNTGAVQRRELAKLLARAKDTEFGKSHDFARLASLSDSEILAAYRKAVPVADWYAYKDQIARMREGAEPDILWPGLVRNFAQTSGTTAGDKYIPVSKAMMRSNYLAALDIFANMARFGIPLSRITGGRILFLGGSTDLSTSDKGIRTGDLSGIAAPMIRWPISEIYSPGQKIALMSHWPSKIEAMARATLDQDIRMISGMPSWGIVLMERVIAMARERGQQVSTIREIWPKLQIFVHGGVKYTPFEPRVRQFWSGSPAGDDVPHRLELYPASEGFVAMQDTPHDPGLRLNADIGMFYEFVPLERMGDPDPPAFAADEVEPGQRYVVVLSTCAGMWRYVLGDVVQFDTIPGRLVGGGGNGPARLRIVGRHRHFINAFGENLIVEHIENAVAAAARATGLVVGEFTAAPIYPKEGQKGAIELAVEVEQGSRAAADALARFRDAFDASLKDQCVDYGVKRTDNLSMVLPTVTPLAVGSFHRWMESRGKLGGQHKCPRCANGREIIDGVLGLGREPVSSRHPT
jgi:hypothetical protein